jgi:hypothetical protein
MESKIGSSFSPPNAAIRSPRVVVQDYQSKPSDDYQALTPGWLFRLRRESLGTSAPTCVIRAQVIKSYRLVNKQMCQSYEAFPAWTMNASEKCPIYRLVFI